MWLVKAKRDRGDHFLQLPNQRRDRQCRAGRIKPSCHPCHLCKRHLLLMRSLCSARASNPLHLHSQLAEVSCGASVGAAWNATGLMMAEKCASVAAVVGELMSTFLPAPVRVLLIRARRPLSPSNTANSGAGGWQSDDGVDKEVIRQDG